MCSCLGSQQRTTRLYPILSSVSFSVTSRHIYHLYVLPHSINTSPILSSSSPLALLFDLQHPFPVILHIPSLTLFYSNHSSLAYLTMSQNCPTFAVSLLSSFILRRNGWKRIRKEDECFLFYIVSGLIYFDCSFVLNKVLFHILKQMFI